MKRPLDSGAIGFQLAPRINAAGRMGDARLALDLLLATNMDHAYPLAEHLERHNTMQAPGKALAEWRERERARTGGSDSAIVIADERWSLGLVGLIAGRLVDQYGARLRPEQGERNHGSARQSKGSTWSSTAAALCKAGGKGDASAARHLRPTRAR